MVGDMLVIAPSAMTKIRADRVNSLGRCSVHLPEHRPIEAFPVFDHFRFDSFSIDREWDENDLSIEPAYPGSSKCDVMDV